eukprot:750108-Hanusia_phi.AAC.2
MHVSTIEGRSKNDLLHQISEFFQSFSSCAVALSSVNRSTCRQACRGQLRGSGDGQNSHEVPAPFVLSSSSSPAARRFTP